MPRIFQTAFTTLAIALLTASIASVSAQELTAAQETAVAQAARVHVERSYTYYYERNPQALATEIFTLPWIQIGDNGVQITTTEAQNLARFEAAIADLIKRGWNRSVFTTKNVCVLTGGSAIVSGTNTRTRADGSVISVNGVSYILGKTDQGWRAISFSSHSPTKVVRCDATGG